MLKLNYLMIVLYFATLRSNHALIVFVLLEINVLGQCWQSVLINVEKNTFFILKIRFLFFKFSLFFIFPFICMDLALLVREMQRGNLVGTFS